ncbi:MAG TPA: hypothetical protein VJG13_03185 [Thermoanaerobaculia bacterium]|nr:hypothetical protein [Thermoanaerobaculia bacterium]
MIRRSIAVFAGALFGATSGAVAVESTLPVALLPECDNPLPQVLDVGLPYSPELDLEATEDSLQGILEALYTSESARCPRRSLRINVALGTDYQILDWLGHGLVDMGVVPALALHLLREDRADLLEIEDRGDPPLQPLVGRVPKLTLTWLEGGEERSRTGHQGDLDRFAREVWRRTASGGGRLPEEGGAVPIDRLVLPSHLSTVGFLIPMDQMQRVLGELEGPEAGADEARSRFWREVLGRVAFSFGDGAGDPPGTEGRPRPGAAVLRIDAEPDSGGRAEAGLEGPPVLGRMPVYRDRFVIRRVVADQIFAPGTFGSPAEPLPSLIEDSEGLAELLAASEAPAESGAGPFSSFRRVRYFGNRPFAFTAEESMALLGLHQRTSGRSHLALVLPGGGVKAAYQSRILEELYARSLLRNSGMAAAGLPAAPLAVESVVGTSGGALLGFFVARLGANGPWNLTDVLWKPGGAGGTGGKDRYLTSSEVFGWTDLPRYVSLVLIYLVFAACLAWFSLRRGGFLSPDRPGAEKAAGPATVRPAVFGLIAAVLAGTPLLVSRVNGSASNEHVPEFEGLLYAILLGLAIFADQCIVRVESEEGSGPEDAARRWARPGAVVAVGLALAAGAVLLRALPAGRRFLEAEVTSGVAYLALGAVAAGLMLSAVHRGPDVRGGRRQIALWLGAFVAASAVAYLLLRLASVRLLTALDRAPLVFLALGLVLVAVAVTRLARGGVQVRSRTLVKGYRLVQNGLDRLSESPLARRSAAVLAPVIACLVMLDLTRPEAEVFLGSSPARLVTATSKLHAPNGGLAVCLGAVLVTIGALQILDRRRNGYRFADSSKFVDGALFLFVGLAFAVYLLLLAIVFVVARLDDAGRLSGSALFARVAELTLFELTPAFWVGLGLASVLGAAALFGWARRGRRRGDGLGAWAAEALEFLGSRHPNAHLLPRRFVRIGLMSVGGLVWWNFVLAPGLYGNRYAEEYLKDAGARFAAAYCEADRGAHCRSEGADSSGSFRLTAQYLAPANALVTDGTRFVQAVPWGEYPCPAVPASPGITWRRFTLYDPAAGQRAAEDDCQDLDLTDREQLETLTDYIFASGSPFPAFPPRRVQVPESGPPTPWEDLIDGGYSNNVPIEVAASVGAEQALVVHSSHPVPQPAAKAAPGLFAGPLVRNLPRLVGFLYERSQQLDRRSRASLFVVSVAPPYHADWPLLTDFRSTTVKRMICEAEENLGLESDRCRGRGRARPTGLARRIGLVEGWGPPRFQISVEVQEPGEPEPEAPGGLGASEAGSARPLPAVPALRG